jgi:murein DD-endopeptidase MepM/ murein hydrolase activator NlpD
MEVDFIRGKRISVRKLMAVLAISVLTAMFAPTGTPVGLADSRTDAQNVQNDINTLNVQLAEAVARYDEQAAKLDELNAVIDQNQADLQATVAELVKASGILDKRAIGIYKRGDVSSLEVIFNSKSLGDFLQQMDLLTRIGDRDASIVEQVELQKKAVDEKAKKLDQQHAEQQRLTEDLANQRDAIDSQISDKTNVLASILQDIANLDAAEAERAAKQRSQPSNKGVTLYDVIPGLGGYWGTGSGPLGPGEWSDHGPSGHGVWLGGDAFDLMCGDGVPVYAAHSGVVTEIGYGRGGYQVISGGGFETCYAHADPYTFVGQQVSGGENIGVTGSGFEHLHFELFDGGEAVPAGDYASYF